MRDGPYTIGEVARLLGLREDLRSDGERDVTFLDLLSLAEDPGGDQLQYRLALEAGEPDAWMARRGPIDPGSDEAAVLWDFLRAMRNVGPLKDSMVIGLLALGFSFAEIGAVLGRSRSSITDQVKGARVRDRNGRPVRRWEGGPVARKPDGLVHRLTDAMNGDT